MEFIMGEKNRSGVRTEVRDGRKILVIDFRFTDKDGRESRYRRDASVQTAAGARSEADRLKRLAADRGTLDVEPAPLTLAAFVEGDFTKLVLPRLKPSTRKGYEELLNAPEHGLLALLGKKRLDAIGAHEYRVVETNALGRKVRPRYALVCLRTVLREAHELGALARAADLPPLPKRSEKLPLPPPEAVVIAILGAATGWIRVAIALAILAGLRMGEVRALRVCDVNLEHAVLYVRWAYSANVLVDAPKGLDEQPIPLTPLLRAILAEAIAGKRSTDPVVTTGRGQAPSEGGLDGALRRIQERLGIEPAWSLHKLRHYFGTKLLRSGANVETVRRLLRHRDLSSTARYVHATAHDLTDAVALLPGS
jgi:integrase